MGQWVLTVIPQDPCCVQAPMFLEQCGIKSGLTTTPIECFHSHTNFFHELTRVDGTYSTCVLPVILYDPCCVQALMFLEQWERKQASQLLQQNASMVTNFFHELASVVGTQSCDWSRSPTSYSLGSMLCSSSDVSRFVRNDIRPDDYSNRILPQSHKFLS